jgi:hypothetical protein
MTNGPPLCDDATLDDVVRQAAPRAPETLLPRVLAEVAAAERARRRRQRWMMGMMGGAVGALAVAALVLLLLRTRSTLVPSPEPAPALAAAGTWRLVATTGEVVLQGGQVGEVLPVASTLTVAAGGSARLEGEGGAVLLTRGLAALRTEEGAVLLLGGAVRLHGDGIAVKTVPARIHTMGRDADVELRLQGRGDMENRFLTVKKSGVAAAALGTALLAVHVHRGQAEVERHAGAAPLLLAAGDGVLLGSSGPPLVLRAPAAAPAAVAVRVKDAPVALRATTPAPGSPASSSGAARAISAAVGEAPRPPAKATLEGALDKEEVRAGIQKIIPQIQSCYETALEKTPGLGGRLLVSFKIRAQGDKGVVAEGEIQPDSDSALLDVPETGQCILDALVAAEFPAPVDGGEVTVSYPFVLADAPPELP